MSGRPAGAGQASIRASLIASVLAGAPQEHPRHDCDSEHAEGDEDDPEDGGARHRSKPSAAGRARARVLTEAAARRDAEHVLVERLPVRRDLPLDGAERHRAVADEVVELVLELVLDVVAGVRVAFSGIEVGDVVRAAEFERDDVVDLERRAVAPRRQPVLDSRPACFSESGTLRIVLVRKLGEQMTLFVSLL